MAGGSKREGGLSLDWSLSQQNRCFVEGGCVCVCVLCEVADGMLAFGEEAC